ncbi:glycogen synthase GlgA [Facklamia miroungae]|uniref:Glycogen synthase n=1 Tax=Facklamia miroungae TaxID=120956 RepID=A0A1G7QU35_9LACT|nr:glycogen synthase GlgA [Facklamia miroungae]NKZ29066.1 glycogen synthase GlgA [Facklamia miroungae]SDG02032.1 starch synthase [Facklamia miroungae]
MKILFASAEAAPFFKTGGLGDVSYALPKELAKDTSIDIRVVLPLYSQMSQEYSEQVEEIAHFRFQLGQRNVYCGIKQLCYQGVIYYFIDNLAYFDRAGLYGEWDDGERFAYFSTAIIEMLEVIDWIPDIIHCNDWQTAMVPALLVDRYHWKQSLQHIRKVLTIHNLRFQGIYDAAMLPNVFGTGYNAFTEDGLKFGDQMNFLKGGINFADRVTTVSPTYAKEILTPEFGEGLDPVLRVNEWKLRGIINGIDQASNDPKTDKFLSHHYDAKNISNKVKLKTNLQAFLSLEQDENVPLIGIVSRLTDQKGMQLVEQVLDDLLQQKVQMVILGTGDQRFEDSFRYFENKYPSQFRACIQFDINLAQQIYAASDLFLMPSAFEPCGLSQMIAMRYGTLPLVHETGGLKDTVEAYNKFTGQGTGFSFHGFNRDNLLFTLNMALDTYFNHKDAWQHLIVQAMEKDFSWSVPAKAYKKIYDDLLKETIILN